MKGSAMNVKGFSSVVGEGLAVVGAVPDDCAMARNEEWVLVVIVGATVALFVGGFSGIEA